MAEESPRIQNSMLLVVALILGALVVVIYNVHIYLVRNEDKGVKVSLLQFSRPMTAGEKIEARDLTAVEVDQAFATGLGNYVPAQHKDLIVGQKLTDTASKGHWVLWRHTTAPPEASPTAAITPGSRAVPIPLDSQRALNKFLRAGDYVDVVGLVKLDNKPIETYRILKGVKLLEAPTQRTANIELDPKTSQQLSNILTRVMGNVWLEPHNPLGERGGGDKLDAALKDVKAVPPGRNISETPISNGNE